MCALVISENNLETLICSNCGRYLSVLPIRSVDDELQCGRCCNKSLGIASPLEKQYRDALFRCSNRYEGCNQLVKFENTLEHEKNCKSSVGMIRCKKCPQFATTATGIIHHFRRYHSSNVLSKPKFVLDVTNNLKDVFLYYVNDFVFFIEVEYDEVDKRIFSSVFCVNQPRLSDVKQQMIVKYVNGTRANIKSNQSPCNKLNDEQNWGFVLLTRIGSVCNNITNITCKILLDFSESTPDLQIFKSKPKSGKNKTKAKLEKLNNNITVIKNDLTNKVDENNSKLTNVPTKSESKEVQTDKNSVTTQTIPSQFLFGAKLTDNFLEEYPEYSLTVCGTAVFRGVDDRIDLCCSNCKHFTGTNVFSCKNSHIRCWDCKSWCNICNNVVEGYNAEVSSLNELLMLPCRWKCKGNFSGNELRSHEKRCSNHPKLTCPVCQWKVKYPDIESHFKRHENFNSLYFEFSILQRLFQDDKIIYFLLGDIFVQVRWETADAMIIKICEQIEKGAVNLVINDKDVHCLQNKSYRIFKGNKYNIFVMLSNITNCN